MLRRILKSKVIWIVNEYNFPDDVDTRQTNLCKLLNENGYDAYIISGSSDNKGNANRITTSEKVHYVETAESKGFIVKTTDYARKAQRVLVSIQFQNRIWALRSQLPKPDVIISDFAGLFGNVFLRWKKKYGTKVIFDILDLWPEGFVEMGYLKKNSIVTKLLYRMEHKSYREADGIIFSFQGGKDYIVDKGWSKEKGGDVDTKNIGYLNNGVNLETVDQQKEEFVLNDPDLETDKFKAIYLGSVSEFNGLDVLVESARLLQKQGDSNIVILVYGYGNQEEKLKRMVEKYKLNNIKFKGALDKKYALSLLTRSDINVFTFVDSGLLKYGVSPNKLFMYFASGKPVLSMIQPAFDLVEEKKAGISVKNDPETVAKAMLHFSRMDKEEYKIYCVNARKTAEEYDYRNLVHVLINMIEA